MKPSRSGFLSLKADLLIFGATILGCYVGAGIGRALGGKSISYYIGRFVGRVHGKTTQSRRKASRGVDRTDAY
jgi:outer membrane lipoprotein SlyB